MHMNIMQIKECLKVSFIISFTVFTTLAFSQVSVFFDDFESDRGWVVDPDNNDNATTGIWERGNPEGTSYSGVSYQLTTPPNGGANNLVTGASSGSSVGSYDIDGGETSIRSPDIVLPSTDDITLSFTYYLAHYSNSSSSDYLRVKVVGSVTQVVFEELGAGNIDGGVWEDATADLSDFSGETVHLLIEAADNGGGSLVEAGIDDISITHAGVSLDPPWWTLYKEITSTVGFDRAVVEVTMDDSQNPMPLTIRTSTTDKAWSLATIMKRQHTFGNIVVNINIVDYDGNPAIPYNPFTLEALEDILNRALSTNRWFTFTDIKELDFWGSITYGLYIVFEKEVIQFNNDDIGDYYLNYNEVVENVFRKLLKPEVNGFAFYPSTAID